MRTNFRKNHYRLSHHIDRFGKNIIITDIEDWTTDEIVNASLARWAVEDGFRQSKNDDMVAMMPIRHWTDSKIRCHIFTCISAYALLRLIEIRAAPRGIDGDGPRRDEVNVTASFMPDVVAGSKNTGTDV